MNCYGVDIVQVTQMRNMVFSSCLTVQNISLRNNFLIKIIYRRQAFTYVTTTLCFGILKAHCTFHNRIIASVYFVRILCLRSNVYAFNKLAIHKFQNLAYNIPCHVLQTTVYIPYFRDQTLRLPFISSRDFPRPLFEGGH